MPHCYELRSPEDVIRVCSIDMKVVRVCSLVNKLIRRDTELGDRKNAHALKTVNDIAPFVLYLLSICTSFIISSYLPFIPLFHTHSLKMESEVTELINAA